MKKILISLSLFVFVLSSCGNADPKMMAADVCDCMEPALKKLSSKSKKIVLKAFKDGDVQTVIQQEVMTIDDAEQQTKVNEEINAAGKLIQGNKMQSCLEDVDKKYKVYKSEEKKKQNEVVDEMEGECEVGAAIFKYGLKHKDDKANTKTDDETTDEDEPKKKKKITQEEEE